MMNNQIIVIQGPTASGKTNAGIYLARALGSEIISADSRQFYREMTIGTAKPSQEEMAGVAHHFVDCLSVKDTYSAGQFERDALKKCQELLKAGILPVVVGGSGLYVKALTEGLDELPTSPGLRQELEHLHAEEGICALQKRMKAADPAYYARVDRENPVRLIRGIELVETSGKPISALQGKQNKPRPFTPLYLALEVERPALYHRINTRVDKMMQAGLLEEVASLYDLRHLPALQTVGYQELFAHIEGKLSLKEAVELVKRNTRRYAKRQLTWLRKDEKIKWFRPEMFEDMYTWAAKNLAQNSTR